MTVTEIVKLLHAKRIGKGKWTAKCPVHHEKTGSVSVRDMGKRVALKCFGCGATGSQIMKAMGFKASDLFSDSTTMTPEQCERLKMEGRIAMLEARSKAYALNGYFLDPEQRVYWLGAMRRAETERRTVYETLHPEAKAARESRNKLDRFLLRYGWDRLWDEYLKTEKGRADANQWGVH